jgi:acetyl-CoA acetyltransferase
LTRRPRFAAAGLIAGQYDIAVAGGVELMSAVPIGSSVLNPDLGNPTSNSIRQRYGVAFNQGVGAEMMAAKWGFTRWLRSWDSPRSPACTPPSWPATTRS